MNAQLEKKAYEIQCRRYTECKMTKLSYYCHKVSYDTLMSAIDDKKGRVISTRDHLAVIKEEEEKTVEIYLLVDHSTGLCAQWHKEL